MSCPHGEPDDGCDTCDEILEAIRNGAKWERKRIVKWLRECCSDCHDTAIDIERGKHMEEK